MSNRAKGIFSIVISAFGFALMSFCVRWCDNFGDQIGCFQKSFFRNAIALIIALIAFVKLVGSSPDSVGATWRKMMGIASPHKVWGVMLLRAIFGTIGIFCNFYALSKIPVAECMTLNKTAPFFTVVFTWLLLGERVFARQALCLAFAFAGAMLVMRPGFNLNGPSHAYVIALVSGISAGVAYCSVHILGKMKVSPALVVLSFSAFSCLAAVPFMWADFHPMTLPQIFVMLGAGIGAAIGQFGVTAAYRFAEPRSIAAFDYTGVIFAAVLGLLVLGQIPDLYSVLGFAIILIAALYMRK